MSIHYRRQSENRPKQGFRCGAKTGESTTLKNWVTCTDCLSIIQNSDEIIHYRRQPAAAGHRPGQSFRCGAKTGQSTRDKAWVSCDDCIRLLETGGDEYRPHNIPPYMNENEDGIFRFTDTQHGDGFTLEVVPQATGNVEITIEERNGAGHVFTLSHLDRADLLRALLYDFHYSPERGGPNDDKP